MPMIRFDDIKCISCNTFQDMLCQMYTLHIAYI